MELLRDLPVICSKKRRLSDKVIAGRSFTSASSSFFVDSSVFGGLPPPFLGSSDSPWLAILI